MTKEKKKEQAITLIALVITIIVLLILAGVTIATLTGQNGILTQATKAKEEHEIGEEKEAIGVAYSACQIDNYGQTVLAEQLENELKKNGYNVKVTTDGTNLIVTFLDSNRSYTISQEGIIQKNEKEEGIIEAKRLNNKYIYTVEANKSVKLYSYLTQTEITEINQEEGIEITQSGIKQIDYNMFIDNEGKVYTFGRLLGNGTNDTSDLPICLSDMAENPLYHKKITSFYTDNDIRILIDENGNIYTWGEMCGDGTKENRLTPICLNEIEGSPLVNKKITKLFTVQRVKFVRDTQGYIYAWGNGDSSQLLGDGSKNQDVLMPVCISTIPNSALEGKNIVDIEGNWDKVRATDNQGNIYQWGTGGSSGSLPAEYVDEEITYFKNKKIIQRESNIALDQEGKIHTWGYNYYGLLGDGSSLETERTMPVCISNIEGNPLKGQRIVEFIEYDSNIIARSDQGKIYVWGNNQSGELGLGNTNIINKPICLNDLSDNPLQGKNIIQMQDVYNGVNSILARDNQGSCYQIGKEATICLNKLQGSELEGKNVLEINESGYNTLVARDNQGNVYTWGDGSIWEGNSSYGDYSIEVTDTPVCLSNKTTNLLYQKKVKKIFNSSQVRIYYTEDGKLLYNSWLEPS